MSKAKGEPGGEQILRDKRIWARHAMWAAEEQPARDLLLQQLPDAAGKAEAISAAIRQPAVGSRATEHAAAEPTGPEEASPASEPGQERGSP